MLAIIGGTGLAKLANLQITHRQVVRTPYGEPSGALTFGRIRDREIVFLARHGYGHTIPPHKINYRANIWALHALKVTRIASVASVGGIRLDLVPGKLVVPHQVIDYTWGRESTFFDSSDKPVTHVDMTNPYDEKMRQALLTAAKQANEPVAAGGVYATTQGPRLETTAEVVRLEKDGADMVGMTGMPETALARELGLPYATLAVVANYAAGRGASTHGIRLDLVHTVISQAMGRVRNVVERLVEADGN